MPTIFYITTQSNIPLRRLSISGADFDRIVESKRINRFRRNSDTFHSIYSKMDPIYTQQIRPQLSSHNSPFNQPMNSQLNQQINNQINSPFNPQFNLQNDSEINSQNINQINPYMSPQRSPNLNPHMNGFNSNRNNKVSPISHNSNNQANNSREFEVLWHNLSYRLPKFSLRSKQRKNILKKLNGCFRSSEVMAIMGPSGAGKSTLLEIICGRRKHGVKGEIRIRGVNEIKVGFVPQDTHLMELLTVKETFVFSSKLLNLDMKGSDHNIIADKLITRFGLLPISGTRVNRCSGGQRKRLSIALEVLSKPNILILDEPTTGLDSPSCTHVMDIMQELVSDKNNPIAIVTTIHQPSVALFNAFHRIYILTSLGKCVYQGTPRQLIPTLAKVGLQCDQFTSPADYIIEISAGDYGEAPIQKMCQAVEAIDMEKQTLTDTKTLKEASKLLPHPFLQHLKILFIRSQVILYRDPFLTFLRIGMSLFCAVNLALIFGRDVGTVSGCAPREIELYATPIEVLSKKFETDLNLILQNVCLLFLGLMIGFISGLTPTLLNFPKEMHVFYKEYHNGWYSCITYYIARMLSDVPLQIITPVIYIVTIHDATGQPPEAIRFMGLIIISILLSFLAQSIGECTSAIWMENQNAAVFAGGLIPLPMILFGGFLVKVSRMPAYLRPLSWLSFLRFAFEAMLVSTYGYSRCEYNYQKFLSTINVTAVTKPLWAQSLPLLLTYIEKNQNDAFDDKELTDEETVKKMYQIFGGNMAGPNGISFDHSLILSYFDLDDSHLITSTAILFGYMVAIKILTYFVLLSKLHSAK